MARNVQTGIVETAPIGVGYAVKKGTAANGVVLAGANEKALGISDGGDFDESNAIGDQLSFAVDGIVQAMAGGTSVSAIAMGDSLTVDSVGKMIKLDGVSTTHQRCGVAMEANTGADNLFKMKVIIDEIIIP